MVTPCGKSSWKSLSFHGKKCFTWHSARPCDQAASMVGWIAFSTSSRSARLSWSIWTVREVTSILSEIRWHPLGRRKSMRLTIDKLCNSLIVWQRSTTVLGKTYSRALQDWVQEIWQCSALGSTWHAIIYFLGCYQDKLRYQDSAWNQCAELCSGASCIAMQQLQTRWCYLDT